MEDAASPLLAGPKRAAPRLVWRGDRGEDGKGDARVRVDVLQEEDEAVDEERDAMNEEVAGSMTS